MPFEWQDMTKAPASPGAFASGAPVRRLRLRPHQSLGAGGFVTMIAATAVLLAVPLLAVLGTPVLWGLLPFVACAVAALWWGLRRNAADRRLSEELTLTPDRVVLVRREPHGRVRRWEANPHWVSVHLHPGARPVPHYLTLRGGGREVELGAFLSPEERLALHGDLTAALARVAAPH